LRLDVRSIGPSRFGIRFAGVSATEAAPGLADLQTGGKAFEVALLLAGKVDRERIDFHGARRSSCGHDRGVNGKGKMTALKPRGWNAPGSISRERSDQPRCCGNPSRTKPAGICDGWLQRNIQVACHPIAQ